MHIAFDMEFDKALSSVLPSFDPYQKDYFINNDAAGNSVGFCAGKQNYRIVVAAMCADGR